MQAPVEYRRFVAAGVGVPSPWSELRGQVLLGSALFAERFRGLLAQQSVSSEVPRADRLAARLTLESLLPEGGSSDLDQRNAAIRAAHLTYGYTLAEIARHVGLHYSTVSRIAQDPILQFKT